MKRKLIALTLLLLIIALLMCACENKENVSVTSIKVVEGSMKDQYEVGEEMDISGGQLLITMSDGSTSFVTIDKSMFDISKFNTKTSATKRTLRITYNNSSCSFVYSVKAKPIENKIENVFLENMPTHFLKGGQLDLQNGVLTQGLLCIDLGNGNIKQYNVKGIWIKDFSTEKTGTHSTTIEYASDYGDVSIEWEYTVLDLASVEAVTPSKKVAVYQGDELSALQAVLNGVSFTILYSDESESIYEYSSSFKISGFSSSKIGEDSCTISFYDKEQRSIRFTYKYDVKKIYPSVRVTFDENYPDGAVVIENTEDGVVTPREPQRKGWEFKGWYKYDGSTLSSQVYDFTQIIEEEITLKARWLRSTYTIYLNNLGSQTGTINYTVDDEKQIPLPDNIPGFIFQYYVDANGTRVDFIPKGSTGDMYLTGIWTELGFTISYNLNDSDSSIKATNSNPEVYSSQTEYVFLPAERPGYTFKGWTYNNQPILSTLNQSGALYLVANWELDIYTITMVNGDTEEIYKTVKYRITDTDTLLDNYQNDAYIFGGWYLDKEYQNEFTKNSSGIYYIPQKSNGNFTLYAKVTECYTVRLLTNRSSTDGEQIIVITFTDSDEEIELPISEKFGMDFLYWRHQKSMRNFSPDKDGKIILKTSDIKAILSSTDSGHTFTLNALYSPRTHKITYVLYDNVTSTDTYTTDMIKTLLVPERDGYTFLSWHTDESLSGTPYNRIEAESMDEDKTFYAKWRATVYTITVHYILDNVKKGNIPLTYTAESETFMLEAPSADKYVFDGWYSDPEYTTPQAMTIFKGSYGNIEIYAKWSSERGKITLMNMEDGVYSGNTTYPLNGGTIELEDATRKGYSFKGFYINQYYTIKVESFNAVDYPDGITLYAKWELVTYSISYVLNDDKANPATNDNPTTYDITSYPTLNSPTRNGYTFKGWYRSASVGGTFDDYYKVTALTGFASDITLYCSWEIANYSISYVIDNKYPIDQSTLPKSYTLSGLTLSNLSVDYYTFSGWYENGTDNKITSLGKNSPCRDIVLTPSLTPIQYQIKYTIGSRNGKKNTTYTVEDFENGVYTLPTLDELLTLGVIEAEWCLGQELICWKSGDAEISITLENTNKTKSTTTSVKGELEYITYSINYNLNGSTLTAENPSTFTIETPLILNDAVMEGKAFKGWADEQGNILGTHSNGKTTINNPECRNLSLKAVFVDIYSITYENVADVVYQDKVENFSEAESQPLGTPTKVNNTFAGWWYIEGSKLVNSTSDLSGNSTLIPLFYDKNATTGLTFKLNTLNNTASITGLTKSTSVVKLPSTLSGYSVTGIESNAFANSSMTSITISENIQTIQAYAFSRSKLTSVVIPESVTLIQSYAFNECSSITSVELKGETVVESEAFKNNSKLTTLIIANISKIKENAFKGSTAISKIITDSSNSIIKIFSKENPNSPLYYNGGGYYIPYSLTDITISGEVNSALSYLQFTKLTLTSSTMVELSENDISLIKTNNASVYVSSSLLDSYKNNAEYASISSQFQGM